MNPQPKSATLGLDQQWSQVQGMLRAEFGDMAYRTWLAPLTLAGLEGDRVLLTVPTRFLRDWVAAHYADRIRALWRRLNPEIGGVALTVVSAAASPAVSPTAASPPSASWTSAGAAAGPAQASAAAAAAPRSERGGRDRRAARPALHIRELRRRHAERARLRRGQAGRRAGLAALQSPVPLRRRRPRQDPSDARHRLADPRARTRGARSSTCRPRSSCTSSSRRCASRTR